ncbi:hypothetical protein [Carp edema virus]|nr:hypothetical protein [Carp edema virus]
MDYVSKISNVKTRSDFIGKFKNDFLKRSDVLNYFLCLDKIKKDSIIIKSNSQSMNSNSFKNSISSINNITLDWTKTDDIYGSDKKSITEDLKMVEIDESDLLNVYKNMIRCDQHFFKNFTFEMSEPIFYNEMGFLFDYSFFYSVWNKGIENKNVLDIQMEENTTYITYEYDQDFIEDFIEHKNVIKKLSGFVLDASNPLKNLISYDNYDYVLDDLQKIYINFSNGDIQHRALLLNGFYDFNTKIHYDESIRFDMYLKPNDSFALTYEQLEKINFGKDNYPKFVENLITKDIAFSDNARIKLEDALLEKLKTNNFHILDFIIDFVCDETILNSRFIFITYLKSLIDFNDILLTFVNSMYYKILLMDFRNFRIPNLKQFFDKTLDMQLLELYEIYNSIYNPMTHYISGLNQLDFNVLLERLIYYLTEYCLIEDCYSNPFFVFEIYFKYFYYDLKIKFEKNEFMSKFEFVENYFIFKIVKGLKIKNAKEYIKNLYIKENMLKNFFLRTQIFGEFLNLINVEQALSNS